MLSTCVKENIRLKVEEKILNHEMFTDKDIADSLGYSTEEDLAEVNEEIYRLWSMDEIPSYYTFTVVALKIQILRDGLAYNDYIVHHPKGKDPKEHPCPYEKKNKK